MNVFEFHERYGISLTKARRIAKDKPQWFDGNDSAANGIRSTLAKGNALTAVQLLQLIETPSHLLELGKHASEAERAISALGNARGEAAPKLVVSNIMEAARNEPEAVQILIEWLISILPARPVEHAYIATRLLLGVPESVRKFEAPRIPRALLNARQRDNFAPYWHVVKGPSRNKTLYGKKGFDL